MNVCNPLHPQKMKTIPRKQKLCFELEEPRIHQMSLISLDILVASIIQRPRYQCRILSIVNLHTLLQADFSTSRDESLLPPIHGIQKHSKHFSTITWHYDQGNIHIFRNYNSNGTWPVWQPQRLLVQRGAVLYSILFKCDGTRPLFPHSTIPPLWRRWQPSEPWRPRLR